MYSTPTPVWNAIAASQPLTQPWARMFAMTFEELTKAWAEIYKEIEAKGADDKVCRAYAIVAPLLVENEAISSYIMATHRLDLRMSMPEINSPEEAVMVASEDLRMAPSQQKVLLRLLREAVRKSAGAKPSAPQPA